MLKIVKSGSVVLSSDVFTIQDKINEVARVSDEQAADAGDMRSQEELDQSIAMSEAIIEKAMEDAERIQMEGRAQLELERGAMLEQVAREAEDIKQQAYRLGLQQGMLAQAQTVAKCIKDLELAVSHIEGEQAGFMAEYESDLKWLALEIASKVLNKHLEQDNSELNSLIKSALGTVKNAEWIRLELSESMSGLIDTLSRDMKRAGEERIEVHGISAPLGTCIVDTPTAKVDASIYTQLQNLKEYFTQQ